MDQNSAAPLAAAMQQAQTLIAAGQAKEAIDLLKPFQAEPSAALHDLLGIALFQVGDHNRSRQEFQMASELDPANPSHTFNLGRVYERLGSPHRAVLLYRRAIDLRPDYAPAREALSRLSPETPSGAASPRSAVPDGWPTPVVIESHLQPAAQPGRIRRSGSTILGGVVGLVMIAFGLNSCDQVRPLYAYRQTTCRVASESLHTVMASSGRYRYSTTPDGYRPAITFSYQVDGKQYTVTGYNAVHKIYNWQAAEAILNSYQPGGVYPCWYDPQRPELACLDRSIDWRGIVIILSSIVTACIYLLCRLSIVDAMGDRRRY